MSALLAIVLFAAPTPPGRAHFLKAQELFGQEKYREALVEFSAANETSPREIPELYFNIAQCHRNLGQPRQAAAALERYLTLKPDARDRREVRALIARLRVTPPLERGEPEPAPPEPSPPAIAPASASAPPSPSPSIDPPIEPAPVEPVALPAPVLAPRPEAAPPPRKSRKALWIAIGVAGGVIAAGLGLGLGLGLPSSHSAAMPAAPMLGSAATFDTRNR